jgi:hypothetical protein
MSGEFRTFVLFFNGGVHWKGFGLSVAEGRLQPALYFFYKGPFIIPAHLVESDIIITFVTKCIVYEKVSYRPIRWVRCSWGVQSRD